MREIDAASFNNQYERLMNSCMNTKKRTFVIWNASDVGKPAPDKFETDGDIWTRLIKK